MNYTQQLVNAMAVMSGGEATVVKVTWADLEKQALSCPVLAAMLAMRAQGAWTTDEEALLWAALVLSEARMRALDEHARTMMAMPGREGAWLHEPTGNAAREIAGLVGEMEKRRKPEWRISTPVDEHTCPHCEAMNGKTLPGDTPFKDLPPFKECTNPDGCRCQADKP